MREIHDKIDLLLRKIAIKNEELQAKGNGITKLDSELLRLNCLELYDAIHELSLPREISFKRKPVSSVETKMAEVAEIKPNIEEIILDVEEIKPIQIDQILRELKPENIEINSEGIQTEELPFILEEKSLPEIAEHKAVEQTSIIFDEFQEDNEPPLLEVLHSLEEAVIAEPEVEEINIEPEPKKVVEVEVKSYDMPKFVPVTDPLPIKKPAAKLVNDEKSLLEKISATQKGTSLHDTISSKKEDLGNHDFSSFKLSKITDAIDISKRFELQNNLFGGNSQHYAQSINLLEIAKNKFDALEEFNRLAEQFHWDAKDELVVELKNYINRKF